MNAEDKLHSAICNAVILLNNGEEIAPRVSAILRTALAEYVSTPPPTAQPSAKDGVRGDAAPVAEVIEIAQYPDDYSTVKWLENPPEAGTKLYTHPATTAAGLVDDVMAERFLNEFEGVPNHPRSLSKLQRTKTALEAAIGREVGK